MTVQRQALIDRVALASTTPPACAQIAEIGKMIAESGK